MKSFFVLCSLAVVALAQSASITTPSAGQILTKGRSFTVTVQKPDSLSASTDIGIGISLAHCTQSPCSSVVNTLGSTLYAGAFDPQRASNIQQPTQNITITIPSSFQSGPAVMSLEHAFLVGAGPNFASEITNVTIDIA